MNKTQLFIDESKAILTEKGWEIDLGWLTADALNVPYVDSFIAVFTRLCNEQAELTQESVSKLFEALKGFVEDVKVGKYKELLGMRYDPHLYMSDEELKCALSDALDKKLRGALGLPQEDENLDIESLMKLMSMMQYTRPHQYAKRKKTKVAR